MIQTKMKFMLGLSVFCVISVVCVTIRQLTTHHDISMVATPCTQGETISEWLGAQTAFLQNGYQLYPKLSEIFISTVTWIPHGGIVGDSIAFSKMQKHLIDPAQAVKSYNQCHAYLEQNHAGQTFSNNEIDSYLKELNTSIERNSRLTEGRSILVSYSTYFSSYYEKFMDEEMLHQYRYRHHLQDRMESLKLSDRQLKLSSLTRGHDPSTLLGAMSAVIVFSTHVTANDWTYSFVEDLATHPEKFGLDFAGDFGVEVDPHMVLRGFETAVKFLDEVKENGEHPKLSRGDTTILITKIMTDYLETEDPKAALALNKAWVDVWGSRQEPGEFEVKQIVDQLMPDLSRHALQISLTNAANEEVGRQRAAMQEVIAKKNADLEERQRQAVEAVQNALSEVKKRDAIAGQPNG
jgi:hypothetical protein